MYGSVCCTELPADLHLHLLRSRLQSRVLELEKLLLSAESDRASCQREALKATEVLATMRSTNEEVSGVSGCSGG